jgi:copper(I)-binding protein
MKMAGNVMYMHEVEGGLEIMPGQKIELNPSGYHLMFMDPRRLHNRATQ